MPDCAQEPANKVHPCVTVPGANEEYHEVLPEALPVVAPREPELEGVEVHEDFQDPRAAPSAAAVVPA